MLADFFGNGLEPTTALQYLFKAYFWSQGTITKMSCSETWDFLQDVDHPANFRDISHHLLIVFIEIIKPLLAWKL